MTQSFEQEFLFENPFNSEWDSGHFANPANGRISGIRGRGDYPATDAGGFEPYFHQQQIDPIGWFVLF